MKRHFLIIAIAFIGLMLGSCTININTETVKGDGHIVTREYDINRFDKVVCALPATVKFSVADEYTCNVRVDENLLDYVDIKVEDGEMVLSQPEPKGGNYVNFNATEFVIDITAPSVDEITLAGSGDINILSPLNEQKMEVTIAGSGNVNFKEDINVDHLEVSVAGSGDISIEKGMIRELEANVAGSGDIISHAEAQEMEATVMGSGDITANVTGKLEYQIIGSGDIYYYGDAKVNGKIAGSGGINRIEAPSR